MHKVFSLFHLIHLTKDDEGAFLSPLEAFDQRCSVKKCFLEISGEVAGACKFMKKETLAQVLSCEFCEISRNIFSHRTPSVGASLFP